MKRNGIFTLTLSAMLIAMSVVIGIFCKTFLNFGGGLFRITFENLPIILSGIMFGPLIATVVGVATDLISYLLSPQIYPPNLIVTLGAATIGFLSGFISHYLIKKRGYAQIIVSGICAHAIGSMIIKSAGLFVYYEWLVLWRIPTYVIISAIEAWIACYLYKNRAFAKIFKRGIEK